MSVSRQHTMHYLTEQLNFVIKEVEKVEAYEILEIEIISFDTEDVITSSSCPNETEEDDNF